MSVNPAKQSANGKGEQKPVAKWTVMIYFAADNDLEEEAINDLKSMKKVGSTDDVNIIAQLDSRGRGNTFRFLLGDEQTTLNEDVVGDPLPEINTGDPRELTKFIVWGADTYEAENYMLVLWGHGRGWEDLDNSDRAAAPTTDAVIYKKDSAEKGESGEKRQPDDNLSIAMTRQKEIRTFLKGGTVSQETENTVENFAQLLSKRTESEVSRGLLTDQTFGKESEASQDVLKINELESALAEARKRAFAFKDDPKRQIAILGMDACLMGMVEVGHQIKDHVKYMVASEDAIPDEGWPYERILARLVKSPDMSPGDLAVTIIREFLLYYREKYMDVTKSACDLARSDDLTRDIQRLALELTKKIRANPGPVGAAILASRAMTQSFYLKDYVDLYNFCANLRLIGGDKEIEDSCSKLMETIEGNKQNDGNSQSEQHTSPTEKRFVHSYGFIGHRLRDANGVSIYFPCFNPSPKYAELQFAEKSKWGEFLGALSGLFSEQGSFSAMASDTVDVPPVAIGGKVKSDYGTREKLDHRMQEKLPVLPHRRERKYPITPAEETMTEKTRTRGKKKEVAKNRTLI